MHQQLVAGPFCFSSSLVFAPTNMSHLLESLIGEFTWISLNFSVSYIFGEKSSFSLIFSINSVHCAFFLFFFFYCLKKLEPQFWSIYFYFLHYFFLFLFNNITMSSSPVSTFGSSWFDRYSVCFSKFIGNESTNISIFQSIIFLFQSSQKNLFDSSNVLFDVVVFGWFKSGSQSIMTTSFSYL